MKTKSSEQNWFIHIITAPIRALCKARDFYVKSLSDCANENAVALQRSSQSAGLPRSFSAASSRSADDDYRELVRAASARSTGSRTDIDNYIKQERKSRPPARSVSAAMGRIDEERPSNCSGEDVKIDGENGGNFKKELKYPRSKSHAVARTPF